MGFVDAPVLGTREPAESGDLLVLASGPERLRERCEPVLDAVGRATMWVGCEAGAGSRLKVVVNSWLLGLVGPLAEAVALAKATGVAPERFLEAIEGGPAYARIKGAAMIAGPRRVRWGRGPSRSVPGARRRRAARRCGPLAPDARRGSPARACSLSTSGR
ncbi:hypothetical protein BH20ACT9_BH20ACT9_21070 [soil metagenome]